MPKVSVIIPVYNTEQYLERCLDSIVNQTLSDIEIICVNDASTDGSLDVLKRYSAKDNRIKIIDLSQNYGAGYARNRGIETAQGEYIGFVDSDDYIDLNFYETLYMRAKEINADIVKAQMVTINEETGETVQRDTNNKIRKRKTVFCREFTTAIYPTSFLRDNRIFFPEKIDIFEDPVFLVKIYVCNKTLELVDNTNYFYNLHSKSNARDYTNKKAESFLEAAKMIIDIMNDSDISKAAYKTIYRTLIFRFFANHHVRNKHYNEQENIFFEKYKMLMKACLKYQDDIAIYDNLEEAHSEYFEKPYMQTRIKELIKRGRNV